MMGQSHAVFGGVATATLLIANGYTPAGEGIVPFGLAVLLGTVVATLPDIDTPDSVIRNRFGVGDRQSRQNLRRWRRKSLFEAVLYLLLRPVAILLNFLAKLFPHRGPTHWLIVAAGLIWLVRSLVQAQGWSPMIWQAFAIGYLSHLVADSCTKSGLKLFAPFYQESVGLPIRWLRVRTGSWQEGIALGVLLAPMLNWMLLYYW